MPGLGLSGQGSGDKVGVMSSPWSQERYLAAYHFAARAHQGQLYPGTQLSYLMHLSFVSMEVIAALQHEPGHDGDLAVQCALLHDVIEDTEQTFEQVLAQFGPAVAAGVQALTKDAALPKPRQLPDSLQRIRQQPGAVWLVKLADRIANLQEPPGFWQREKRIRYRRQAEAIHAALGEASPYLAARLAAKIAAYERFIRRPGGGEP